MRAWMGTVITAAAGGAVTTALLLGSGTVRTEHSASAGDLPPVARADIFGRADGAGGRTARTLFEAAAPAVVSVHGRALMDARSPFAPSRTAGAGDAGSGFVIDADKGLVITNAHTVAAASDIVVTFRDGRAVRAVALGRDDDTDLALLAVDPQAADLTALELDGGARPAVGDPTMAIGNPDGRAPTMTVGVVSAARKRLVANHGVAVDGVIQTDATAEPGDTGGPLLDAEGHVIGVTGQLTVGGVVVGFAVPADTVAQLVPQLVSSGHVRRAFLGIRNDGPGAAPGVRVDAVRPGSPAARIGLRAGDRVEAVAGETVRTIDDLCRVLAGHTPGEQVALEVSQGTRRTVRSVRLADRPAGIADR